MARIGKRGSAGSLSRRRILFLSLLLLTLVAPAGWVAAGEFTSPYLVLFDPAAVSVPDTDADFTADAVHSFRDLAAPPALRAITNAAGGSTATAGKTRVDGARVDTHVRAVAGRNHVRVNAVYANAVGGFAASLNRAQLAAISADPSVEAVIPDIAVGIDDGSIGSEASVMRSVSKPTWRVPAGIRRVGARTSAHTLTAGMTHVNADVAILDTGIDRNHPDLNVAGGYNCTSGNRNKWDDNDGHGTHVAGIVGALDNSFGVVGVAPGVRLWSVKVLDGDGNGYLSWLVCGIDWVTSQRDPRTHKPLIEVANMSISFSVGPSPKSSCANGEDVMHQAICRSVAKGITYVVAAGNNSRNAQRNRPAAYDEVITVSAMADYDGKGGGRGKASDSCPYGRYEPDDSFTDFSDYGPDVDLIAPGRCVLSTYMGKRYAFMSGTSMATPHVTGAAAIYRSMYPNAKPAQVRLALQAVGKLDWRVGTDPDSQHEKAVWVGDFRRPPDFTLSTSPAGVVSPGGALNVSIAIGRVGGFSGAVTFTLTGAPSGFSAPNAVAPGQTGTVQIDVGARTKPGTYQLTIVGRGTDVEHSVQIEVVVGNK
jgi:subtilisin